MLAIEISNRFYVGLQKLKRRRESIKLQSWVATDEKQFNLTQPSGIIEFETDFLDHFELIRIVQTNFLQFVPPNVQVDQISLISQVYLLQFIVVQQKSSQLAQMVKRKVSKIVLAEIQQRQIRQISQRYGLQLVLSQPQLSQFGQILHFQICQFGAFDLNLFNNNQILKGQAIKGIVIEFESRQSIYIFQLNNLKFIVLQIQNRKTGQIRQDGFDEGSITELYFQQFLQISQHQFTNWITVQVNFNQVFQIGKSYVFEIIHRKIQLCQIFIIFQVQQFNLIVFQLQSSQVLQVFQIHTLQIVILEVQLHQIGQIRQIDPAERVVAQEQVGQGIERAEVQDCQVVGPKIKLGQVLVVCQFKFFQAIILKGQFTHVFRDIVIADLFKTVISEVEGLQIIYFFQPFGQRSQIKVRSLDCFDIGEIQLLNLVIFKRVTHGFESALPQGQQGANFVEQSPMVFFVVGVDDFRLELDVFDDLFFLPELFEQLYHCIELRPQQFFPDIHDIVHLRPKRKVFSDQIDHLCKFFTLSKVLDDLLSDVDVIYTVKVEIRNVYCVEHPLVDLHQKMLQLAFNVQNHRKVQQSILAD